MPRKSDAQKAFETMAADVVFHPTEDQRQVKSAFWATFEDRGGVADHEVTQAAVLQATNDTRVSQWWNLHGFQDWFLNKEEYKQRLDYLMHIGMDALERVLKFSESDTAIVSAMKLIIAANDKMPSSTKVVYADSFIQDLDERGLDEYLRKHKNVLQAAPEEKPTNEAETEELS